VQHEGHTLGRRQRLQHHQHRQADRIGQQGFLLRFEATRLFPGARSRRLVEPLLAARFARTQHVEADPRRHRRQPAAQIVDTAGVAAAEPQPRFLHGILCLGGRTQHAVGHPSQMGPVGLEAFGQKSLLVHRHTLSSRSVNTMTARTGPE
jgi:hypothetical protein